MKCLGHTHRFFKPVFLIGILGISLCGQGIGAGQTSAEHPNILLIYLDDLGYGDVSCYNPDSKIHTPHIDRLAEEGIIFTDAHTPASICGPSRYGLMTGHYPWRRGEGGTGNGPKFRDLFLEEGRTTLASLLKEKTYNTAQIGKWGLRNNYSDAVKPGHKPGLKESYDFPSRRLLGPQLIGFDYSWCMTHLFPRPGTKAIRHSKHQLENGLPVDPSLEISDPYRWLPDSAMKVVDYLETYAGEKEYPKFGLERDKPFFIYWDPPSPHTPIVPNAEFIGKSDAGAYGDFVLEIDHYVGIILDTLDRLQLSDQTLVIFSSDNGPEISSYRLIESHDHYSMGTLRGVKRDTWEGGHRVPLIVRWPAVVEPGRSSDALVGMTDWLATFAEIVDLKLTEDSGEDSLSLLSLLQGSKNPIRDSAIHHTPSGKFAIRQGDWLFIDHKTGSANKEPDWFREERAVLPYDSSAELFNLQDDPQQTNNLYEAFPEKAQALRELLQVFKTSGRSR